MRVLILSCATGEGHNSAGRALLDTLRAQGETAEMIDFPSLRSEKFSRRVAGIYIFAAKRLPHVFGAVYRLADLLGNSRHKMPVYFALKRMSKPLMRYLDEHPADIIVMPHLYPAETVTAIKRKLRRQGREGAFPATLAVMTDYTATPFWEETECDQYIVAHQDLISEYVEKGIPLKKIQALGIPVSPQFLSLPFKEEARLRLGLAPDKPVVLIMSGSMGFGKIQLFVYALYKQVGDKVQIVVLCGNNASLKALLDRELKNAPTVKTVGYTKEVPLYMAAGDILYTKPGGLTSTEAAVSGIPLVHTAPIPGCETKNAAFFNAHGMSVSEKKLSGQLRAGRALLSDEERLRQMHISQTANALPCAAADICDAMRAMCLPRGKESE